MAIRLGTKILGDVGEEAYAKRLEDLGYGKSINLNIFKEKSDNFPQLDNVSRRGFASVKAGKTAVREAVTQAYELASAEDWKNDDQLKELERAAQLIHENKDIIQREGAWPDSLPQDATKAQILEEITNRTLLIVPEDKLNDCKEAVSNVEGNEELLGLDENAYDQMAAASDQLQSQFDHCGMKSNDMEAEMHLRMQKLDGVTDDAANTRDTDPDDVDADVDAESVWEDVQEDTALHGTDLETYEADFDSIEQDLFVTELETYEVDPDMTDFETEMHAYEVEPSEGNEVDGMMNIDEIDTEGIDLDAIDVKAFEVEEIDVSGIDLEEIDRSGIDVDAIDVGDIDADGLDVDGLDADGMQAEGPGVDGPGTESGSRG